MESVMDNGLPVLIVSCRPENRRLLMRVFEGLPIDSYAVPTVADARTALCSRQFSVVFCEERLADGSYRDLFRELQSAAEPPRLVVLLCTGEWEEYLEALRLGVEEVLRCPLQPTDVDLALIHVMRGGAQRRELMAQA